MESGHRGNLTVAQNRALLLLWKRLIEACDTDTHVPSRTRPQHTRYSSHQPRDQKDKFFSNSNGSNEADFPTNGDITITNSGLTNGHTNGHDGEHDPNDHIHINKGREIYNKQRPLATPPDSTLEKYHTIRNNGSHIAKDDRVKDQMRGAVEAKEMNLFLQKYGGAALRTVFWEIVKGEHPDTFMLRCLRARKWDVDRAFAMIGNIAAFRVENDVFELVKRGELDIVKTVGGAKVYRNGIAYAWGASNDGLPVCYIEVAKHFASNQTQEELKRAIIVFQEWLGMLMPPPVSRKIVCFNMTDFGLRNMDWWCVFFLVKTMEMYWPETLERVYVHKAPWFFKPIWTILRPLLDPVVREKVRFTTHVDELREHIPPEHLPRSTMNGKMDWTYRYPEPDPHENDFIIENEERGQELRDVYFGYATDFENSTKALIRSYLQSPVRELRTFRVQTFGSSNNLSVEEDEPEGADELRAQRDVDATRLRVAWLEWMPYTVAKSKYVRWNVWRPDGTILWTYPQADGSIDYQLFGEGTSLPVLKQSLSLIDEAQRVAMAAMAKQRGGSGSSGVRTVPLSPMSPGGRSRRSRKRTKKTTSSDQEPGQNGTAGAAEDGPRGVVPAPVRDLFGLPDMDRSGPIPEKAEPMPVLVTDGKTKRMSLGTRLPKEFSDTDEELFRPSSGLDEGSGSGSAEEGKKTDGTTTRRQELGVNGRLRSASSAATFGVSRSKAERGQGFAGDAASARAAIGVEKAGLGWPSTPPRDQSPWDHNRFDSSDSDGSPARRRKFLTPSATPEPFRQQPPPALSEQPEDEVPSDRPELMETLNGSLSDHVSNIPAQTAEEPLVNEEASDDSSPNGGDSGISLPRKSMDPGHIAFIPGENGQGPIGQVVYDEDGIPH
ncbi:hypothetical protein OC846_004304 [Tilletia horrida]|uniref:CRAL-TRIO domain-containing protein n=1 Tax=Tilletia horrida TaxID=155126 RepID=A0AAN6JX37_9BASI|nr:hypothetical protein OC846_004304 [Tilletia horrida]KAK0552294.1 hypothetical protein OC845_001774 [Tilletia horrida]